MQRLIVFVLALLVLHACNYKGGGTWSDSAGNSGELKSKLTLKIKIQEKTLGIIYKLKLSNGTKEVFKFLAKKITDEEEDNHDADDKSSLITNMKGEVIGTGHKLEKITVFSLTIDAEKIELRFAEGDKSEIAEVLVHNLVVTGKKTYRDGRVLTWSDNLNFDM